MTTFTLKSGFRMTRKSLYRIWLRCLIRFALIEDFLSSLQADLARRFFFLLGFFSSLCVLTKADSTNLSIKSGV